MTTAVTTQTGREVLRPGSPDARLVAEFDRLWTRLVGMARFRYRLQVEDCEEIAADALLSWYQEQCRHGHGGIRVDAAYLTVVLHNRALDYLKATNRRKRAAETVPLIGDCVGEDPQLDTLVAEREELADLTELACDVLSDRERGILALSRHGAPRVEVAARYGISVRCVERSVDRAQRKLGNAAAVMSIRGRCGMLALTVSDIKTGRIQPGDLRYDRGIRHLHRCARCRMTPPIQLAHAG